MDALSPLDFARKEARRMEGLLELELGSDHPFFIAFRSADCPGTTIVYHTPHGTSVGYTDDSMAVGSIAVELCERLKVSPFEG